MGAIIGMLCETLTGHRLGEWTPFHEPEFKRLRFEHAQCCWCRQWYVRPIPLVRLDWLREATEIQSKPGR